MKKQDKPLSPMMAQYKGRKESLPKDCILLFKIGHFWEAFFEDAKTLHQLGGYALTKRRGQAMSGLPYHELDAAIKTLTTAGHQVALAELPGDDPTALREITKIES